MNWKLLGKSLLYSIGAVAAVAAYAAFVLCAPTWLVLTVGAAVLWYTIYNALK